MLHMCIDVVLASLVGDGPKDSSDGCEGFDHVHFLGLGSCLAQVHMGHRWSYSQDMIKLIFMLYLVKCKL